MSHHTCSLDESLISQTAKNLKAIAHPIRLCILQLLKDEKKMNVTQIHEKLGIEQAVASQHLSILRERNILGTERNGKYSIYYLKHPSVTDAIQLIFSTEFE